MKTLLFSCLALLAASLVDAKPTKPGNWSAVHGHMMRPKPINSTQVSPETSNSPKITKRGFTPFSPSGPKFVSYIDNTVGLFFF